MQGKKSLTISDAKKKLEHYCVYQERCHKEVINKLKELGIIPSAIDLIVTDLIQNNYLNETRFAQSYARGKFNIKKWGKGRILRELKKRGISEYNINLGMKEILDSSLFLLQRLGDRKSFRCFKKNLNLISQDCDFIT